MASGICQSWRERRERRRSSKSMAAAPPTPYTPSSIGQAAADASSNLLPTPYRPSSIGQAAAAASSNLLSATEQKLVLTLPISTDATAAFTLPILDMIEDELANFARGVVRPRDIDLMSSKPELKLTRRSMRDPEAAAKAVGPFIRAALGSAPGVTHDAAARALSCLISGAWLHTDEVNQSRGEHEPRLSNREASPTTFELLDTLSPSSLHRGAEASIEPALRRVCHDISIGAAPERVLLFAVPALTRTGAAVLAAPAAVLSRLRRAYFEELALAEAEAQEAEEEDEAAEAEAEADQAEQPASSLARPAATRAAAAARKKSDFPDDPTSVQRREADKSPIFDGARLTSPHASPPPGGPRPRRVVEWARLPEAEHDEILRGLQPLAEAWCGHKLRPVRFFGVRRYLRGASLESHVDSDPSVRAIGISITVDVEELETTWPLSAEGAEGEAAAAALPVGQCFVYEATRVRHHRPQPLRAKVFANAFAHYSLAEWA